MYKMPVTEEQCEILGQNYVEEKETNIGKANEKMATGSLGKRGNAEKDLI